MKKLLALLLAGVMVFALAACGSSSSQVESEVESELESVVEDVSSEFDEAAAALEDAAVIEENGKLLVGVTDFEPMDYRDGDDWVGFDADLAKAFAESIGVEAEFVEIDWDNKVLELENGNIDCVWNGMTLTDEVTSTMSCSNAYMNNAQIVVVPVDVADQYKDEDSVKELTFAVESGSAGAQAAADLGAETVEVQNQASALMEVAAGTADAAIIDSLMAAAMVGEGTSYDNLTYTVPLTSEEYGVGFRQGSDLTEVLNKFFKEQYDSGELMALAEKYGVQAAVIEQ